MLKLWLMKNFVKFYKNKFWNNLKKIGVSQNVNNRIKSLNTACPENIEILHITNELVDKYYLQSDLLYECLSFIQAKECALIAVDEILFIVSKYNDTQAEVSYWQEVKKEME